MRLVFILMLIAGPAWSQKGELLKELNEGTSPKALAEQKAKKRADTKALESDALDRKHPKEPENRQRLVRKRHLIFRADHPRAKPTYYILDQIPEDITSTPFLLAEVYGARDTPEEGDAGAPTKAAEDTDVDTKSTSDDTEPASSNYDASSSDEEYYDPTPGAEPKSRPAPELDYESNEEVDWDDDPYSE